MTATVTYREIKADMLRRIRDREWTPGERVPSEVELARHYGSARATVSRAMRELAEEGVIERKRKAGTRVREAPVRQARFGIPMIRAEIEAQGRRYRYALIRSTLTPPPDWLCERLSLTPEDELREILCLHCADDVPHQLEHRWINLTAVPAARFEPFDTEGPNEWLVRNVPFTEAEISLTALDADRAQARLLGCHAGDALFCAERQTAMNGRALTFVRTLYRPGHRLTTRY